jgi:hypothetical protein
MGGEFTREDEVKVARLLVEESANLKHLEWEPRYEEFDEVLPRHKEPPIVGGDYPLLLGGRHTRWSIHAAWRDSENDAAPAPGRALPADRGRGRRAASHRRRRLGSGVQRHRRLRGASPINPVELAGGHPHLAPAIIFGHPGQFDRDTRVEVVRIARPGS